jgi:hypothetical protein
MARVISENEFIWKLGDSETIILSLKSPNEETYFNMWYGLNGEEEFCLIRECDINGNPEENYQLTFKEGFSVLSIFLTDDTEGYEITLDTLTNILNEALLDEE